MLKRWLRKVFAEQFREYDERIKGLHACVDGLTAKVKTLEKDLEEAKNNVKVAKKAAEAASLRKWLRGEPVDSEVKVNG
jgi:seryl-tRNA synthetase